MKIGLSFVEKCRDKSSSELIPTVSRTLRRKSEHQSVIETGKFKNRGLSEPA